MPVPVATSRIRWPGPGVDRIAPARAATGGPGRSSSPPPSGHSSGAGPRRAGARDACVRRAGIGAPKTYGGEESGPHSLLPVMAFSRPGRSRYRHPDVPTLPTPACIVAYCPQLSLGASRRTYKSRLVRCSVRDRERPLMARHAERIAAIAGRAARASSPAGSCGQAGIASTTVDRLCRRSGGCVPMHRGVFAVGHRRADGPRPRRLRRCWRSARAPPSAITTAAVLCGYATARGQGDGLIHVTVPGQSRRSAARRARAPQHRPDHAGPAVSATASAGHVSGPGPPRPGAVGHADGSSSGCSTRALVQRVLAIRDVIELLRRCGRHRGRAALQALVDQHTTTTFTRSEAEELFPESRAPGAAASAADQCPSPRLRDRLPVAGARRLAVEIDGFAFHRTHRRFENDTARTRLWGGGHRRDPHHLATSCKTSRWRSSRGSRPASTPRGTGAR